MVLSKSGGAGLAAMASISARCSESAASKAGRKCAGAMAPNGGKPKGPVQSVNSGFCEAERTFVMAFI